MIDENQQDDLDKSNIDDKNKNSKFCEQKGDMLIKRRKILLFRLLINCRLSTVIKKVIKMSRLKRVRANQVIIKICSSISIHKIIKSI